MDPALWAARMLEPSLFSDEETDQWMGTLAESNFLRRYYNYAKRAIPAENALHATIAMGLAASIAPSDTQAEQGIPGFSHDTEPTLWGLIVAPTGSEKSHALRVATSLLTRVRDGEILGKHPASGEALTDILAESPQVTLAYSELSTLLALTRQPGTGERLKSVLMAVFDGESYETLGRKKGPMKVTNPRLCILGACTLSHLVTDLQPGDWSTGWVNRYYTCFRDARVRTKKGPRNVRDREVGDSLVAWMEWSIGARGTRCVGMTDEALAIWQWWTEDIWAVIQEGMTDADRDATTRVALLASRCSLLAAWCSGEFNDKGEWRVGESHVRFGILAAIQHFLSVRRLYAQLPATLDRVVVMAVYGAIGTDWTHRGAVTEKSGYHGKKLDDALNVLVMEKKIMVDNQGSEYFYHRCVVTPLPAHNPEYHKLPKELQETA